MSETTDQDPVERVVGLLKGVKKTSQGGWTARCPAHDDSKPSLSVSRGDSGCALVHCHTGCSVEAICGALGLTLKDLFPPKPARGSRRPKGRATRYDYFDAAGVFLYQIVRTDRVDGGKSFYQRTRDAAGKWVNRAGSRRVLYNLAQLVTAPPGQWVFVVEGEKCADRLMQEGAIATTASGGADGWRKVEADSIRRLTGRRVAVLPDCDDPGESYAADVVQSLAPIAQDLRVVRLPGLAPGGDVVDWLDGGGTLAALVELVDRAPAAHATVHGPGSGCPQRDLTQETQDSQGTQETHETQGSQEAQDPQDSQRVRDVDRSKEGDSQEAVSAQVEDLVAAVKAALREAAKPAPDRKDASGKVSKTWQFARALLAQPQLKDRDRDSLFEAVLAVVPKVDCPPKTDPWFHYFGLSVEDATAAIDRALTSARGGLGEAVLDEAVRAAAEAPLPIETRFPIAKYRHFLNVLARLQMRVRHLPIPTSTRAFAQRLGVSHETIAQWIKWGVQEGHLRLAKAHQFELGGRKMAAEHWFDLKGALAS